MKKILLSAIVMLPILLSAQFSQGFETAGIPVGWTVINGGDTGTWIQATLPTTGTIHPHTGTGEAAIIFGSAAHDDHLVSPAITVTAGVNTSFSFWARSRDPTYPETIALKLSTTTPTAAAFTTTLINSVAPASGMTFYKYTVNLESYLGQTVYISFYSTTTDMFIFDIDDVESTTTLSTNDDAKKLDMSFYPNPVKDVLTIKHQDSKITNVQVFSLDGRKMSEVSNHANDVKIDMKSLPKGTYIVKTKTSNGETSLKIIKD